MLRLAQRALGPAGAALPNGARFLGARHTLSQGMDALAVAGLPDLNAASSSMLPRKSALASGPMLSASPVCASVAASSLVSAAATAAAAAGASSLAVCVAASAPAGARRTFAAPSDKRGANNKEGNPNDLAFTMEGVTKRLDQGRVLFSNITTGFFHGAKIGIIGKNGAGKSTLLKIIAGVDKTFDGAAKPGVGKKVGYLSQEPSLDDTKNVLDNVLLGVAEHKAVLDEYEAVNKKFEDPEADIDQLVERQGQLQTIIDEKNLWDLMRFVDVAMVALRCPPADAMATSLSGGERRRVALCRLLISQPDILLLDEPTNHLDAGSVAWLEQFLAQYSGLVIAITHDRYFLDNVAGYILEIESGRFLPFKGNYAQWLDAKARRVEQEAKDKKALDRVLSRELEWMSRNANGRQAKSKARIAKIEELQKQKANMYKSRYVAALSFSLSPLLCQALWGGSWFVPSLSQSPPPCPPPSVESGSLVIPAGPRLGKKAIAVNNLGLAFDESRGPGGVFSPKELVERKAQGLPEPPWLFRNVNFTVEGGQIVGIVGPNGVGKTTLLKVIQQMMEPSAGNVTIGETVAFGYNAQSRAALRDGALVWQEITDGECVSP